MTASTLPAPVRIAGQVAGSHFLHVEDALGEGQLRLCAGTVRREQGVDGPIHYCLDLADARVLFDALARGERGFRYEEENGTASPRDGPAPGRGLAVSVTEDGVTVTFRRGPGRGTDTGTVAPDGPAGVEVTVTLAPYDARRLAATVLAYVRARDVARLLECGMGTGECGMENEPSFRIPHSAFLTVAEALYGADEADAPLPPVYGDGSEVDPDNATEVATFRRFVAANETVPPSRPALQAYYRQAVAARPP